MAKSRTTLYDEVIALAPNDPSGINQAFLSLATATVQRCNDAASLNALDDRLSRMAVEFIAVEGGSTPLTKAALKATFANDTSGILQEFTRVMLNTWHRIHPRPFPGDAEARFDAIIATIAAEVTAKIAAL